MPGKREKFVIKRREKNTEQSRMTYCKEETRPSKKKRKTSLNLQRSARHARWTRTAATIKVPAFFSFSRKSTKKRTGRTWKETCKQKKMGEEESCREKLMRKCNEKHTFYTKGKMENSESMDCRRERWEECDKNPTLNWRDKHRKKNCVQWIQREKQTLSSSSVLLVDNFFSAAGNWNNKVGRLVGRRWVAEKRKAA